MTASPQNGNNDQILTIALPLLRAAGAGTGDAIGVSVAVTGVTPPKIFTAFENNAFLGAHAFIRNSSPMKSTMRIIFPAILPTSAAHRRVTNSASTIDP